VRRMAILTLCHLALLRGAALIVPAEQRREWYLEWSSELNYARGRCHPAWKLTSFCLGSLGDAACVRGMARKAAKGPRMLGSARQCLLRLCALLAVCALIARFLPGVRSEEDAARNQVAPGVIVIDQKPSHGSYDRSIPFSEFQNWTLGHQRYFSRLAFYWPERVNTDGHKWIVGHTSANMFEVLGLPLPGVDEGVLSRFMWQHRFGGNPHLIGEVVWVAHRRIRIAGIAPDSNWALPGKPDVWIVESTQAFSRDSQDRSGYVVAQLAPAGRGQMIDGVIPIAAVYENGDDAELCGTRLAVPADGSFSIYLFSLFFAILALPPVTSVFASESNFVSHPRSMATRVRCWTFVGVKFLLVAAVGYFGAVDVAYCGFQDFSRSAEFLQFLASFSICLFGLRWALSDQSRRCPVCLRLVTHATQVGTASCSFLDWSGTEMVCMEGHVLLHVPNLPTSWFSQPRWTYLDTSWDFLFAD
jgi:hypothetical protein